MDLRVPSGSGGFLDELLSSGPESIMRDDADYWPDVNPAQVVEALARHFRGEIEYVGLNNDPEWIQVAQQRGGGYVFERSGRDGEDLFQYPSMLSAEQVQAAFLAYLGGDRDAGLPWPAEAPVAPKKKRGWFRR